jgi:hypothetical protein
MMTDDAGYDVMNSIKRYKRVLDQDLPEDFVLGEFVKFKEQYDRGGFDMDVERFLEKWNQRAEEIAKDEINFFSDSNALPSQLFDNVDNNLPEPKAPSQAPAEEMKKDAEPAPATEPKAAEEPAASVGSDGNAAAVPAEVPTPAAKPARPPKLENPAQPGDGTAPAVQ